MKFKYDTVGEPDLPKVTEKAGWWVSEGHVGLTYLIDKESNGLTVTSSADRLKWEELGNFFKMTIALNGPIIEDTRPVKWDCWFA